MIHRQFERRQLRLLTDLFRRDLIHRRAQIVVRAFRQLRLGGAQESGVGGRMAAGIRVPQFQICDGGDVFLHRRE